MNHTHTSKSRIYKIMIGMVAILLVLSIVALSLNINKQSKKPARIPELMIVAAQEEIINTVSLTAIGDMIYHSHQIRPVPQEPSGYDYYNNLVHVKDMLEKADITVGTYETTTTSSKKYQGYPTFNTPPESLDALKDAGFDLLLTTHNHALDSGKQGLIDTYNAVVERGMLPLGTKTEKKPFVQTIVKNDISLGFLGYTYSFNGLDKRLTQEEHSYMASFMDYDKIEQEIKASKLAHDFTVVMIHWGVEYSVDPSNQQKDLAQKMVEWGADVILGAHPHVTQEAEMVDNSFVVYSMGNFFSDQRLESLGDIETERGVLIELQLEKNMTTMETRVVNPVFHPMWVNRYIKDSRTYYEVIPTELYLNGTISPYTPAGSKERIQSAHDTVLRRMKSVNID